MEEDKNLCVEEINIKLAIENEKVSLGERMKLYENNCLSTIKIEPFRPFLVRLDGRAFSTFTNGFKKPFDFMFTKAMILTTSDLLIEFNAVTGYSHSDEITLIFKAHCTKNDYQTIKNK